MKLEKREPEASAAAPSSAGARGQESYEAPALAWEEEFEPIAASDCLENPELC